MQDKIAKLAYVHCDKHIHQGAAGSYEQLPRRVLCPYCASSLVDPLFIRDPSRHPMKRADGLELVAQECLGCGWWELIAAEHWTQHANPQGLDGSDMTTLRSKLMDLDEVSAEPIKILNEALIDRAEILRGLHPTAFEKLVRDVLSDFLDCEVHHVGGTGDGGIDLLLLEGDTTHAVQVKRRSTSGKAESVVTVREFVGAMVLEDYSSGYVVTTADSFSQPSKDAAIVASERGYRIELVAVDKFLSILRILHSSKWSPMALAAQRSKIIVGSSYTRTIRLIDLLKEASPERFLDLDNQQNES